LREKHQVMNADLRGRNLRPPRGVLLVGVPGCGKSLSAKAIAAEWSLPLYRLDFASIMGQYVGQSEGRLREALDTADRVSPCVLWIDEIEKGLAGQNDSTGIGRRLIGQFLFWLQESTSRVFLVATANDVRSLPPELLRKGRFNEIFFVDLPDADDRDEIIRLYYQRYVQEEPAPDVLEKLVAASEGFSGADIESVLHEVGEKLLINGNADVLAPDFLLEMFTNQNPLSRSNPEQIDEIRAWGRERAIPAGRAQQAPKAGTSGRRLLVLGDS
jgi:SpoVK/Ycf46/Vps4 family AAA+-type ATPase